MGDAPLAIVISPGTGAALSAVFAGTVEAALGSAAGAGPVEVGGCFEQAAPNPRMNDRINRLFIFASLYLQRSGTKTAPSAVGGHSLQDCYQIGAMFPRHRLAFTRRHSHSIGVLKFRKCLQGFLRGAGEYHLLVVHLKSTIGHDDIFSAHA